MTGRRLSVTGLPNCLGQGREPVEAAEVMAYVGGLPIAASDATVDNPFSRCRRVRFIEPLKSRNAECYGDRDLKSTTLLIREIS